MTTHINHLVRTCFYNLRRIKHIRRFITKTAILLVNSFVISRVDYCNSLLAGLPNCHLHRIQLVLNAAARLLYRGQKRDHITPLLRDKLHWLPIAARIQFKICLLTYKSFRAKKLPCIRTGCVELPARRHCKSRTVTGTFQDWIENSSISSGICLAALTALM